MNEDDKTMDDRIYKILIVDDERDILDAMQLILNNADQFKSDITTVLDGKAAIAEIEKQEYDLVLADYKLPGMSGIDLLTWMKDNYPKTVRILTTGYLDANVARDAINRANVHYYIGKPWDNKEFKLIIYDALKREPQIEFRQMPVVNDIKLPTPPPPPPKREPEKGPGTITRGDNVKEAIKRAQPMELRKIPMPDDLKPPPPPKRKPMKALGKITEVDNVKEALRLVDRFEKSLKKLPPKIIYRQKIMLEFNSLSELNKFSFEVEKRENTHIEHVQVFENKYIVSVSVYPSTYRFLS